MFPDCLVSTNCPTHQLLTAPRPIARTDGGKRWLTQETYRN
jgi:hypothetical protein